MLLVLCVTSKWTLAKYIITFLILFNTFITYFIFKRTYPSILFTCFIHTWVAGVHWSLSQLSRGEWWGTPWTGCQPIAGPTQRHTTFTLALTLDRSTHLSMILDCGRKSKCPENLTSAQEEDVNTTQKGQNRDSNLESSCSEVLPSTTFIKKARKRWLDCRIETKANQTK